MSVAPVHASRCPPTVHSYRWKFLLQSHLDALSSAHEYAAAVGVWLANGQAEDPGCKDGAGVGDLFAEGKL